MRIGGREITFSQQTPRQDRQAELRPRGPSGDAVALGGLATGVGTLGAAWRDEEQQRDRFRALAQWTELKGQFTRRYAELANQAPADGSGFVQTIEDEWKRTTDSFFAALPQNLHDEFRVREVESREQFLTNADTLSRQAAKGFALDTIAQRADDVRGRIYTGEVSFEQGISELMPFLDAAPLSPIERQNVARETLRAGALAAVSGQLKTAGRSMSALPFSPDSDFWLKQVVWGIESNYTHDAESPVGAVGIGQVLENDEIKGGRVGSEVARELGDKNFPFDGTIEERRAYLKREDVGPRYSAHVWNRLLRQYDGDVELALVGYNAGPKRVAEYVAAGRNPEVLPKETQGYLVKAMQRAGVKNPQLAFAVNGLMQYLQFEDRLKIESIIEAQNRAVVDAAEAERQKAVVAADARLELAAKALSMDLFRGDKTASEARAAIREAIDEVPVLTQGEREKAYAKYEGYFQQAELASWQFRRVMSDPEVVEAFDTFLATAETSQFGFEDALSAMRGEAANLAAERAAAKTAYNEELGARYNEALFAAARGTPLPDILERFKPGELSFEQFEKLRNQWETYHSAQIKAGEALSLMDAGIPLTEQQQKDISLGFTKVVEAMKQGEIEVSVPGTDETAVVTRETLFAREILPIWERTGQLPANVKTQLTAMLRSPSWQDRQFAFKMAEPMWTANDRAFQNEFGADMAQNVMVYSTLSRAYPVEEVQKWLGAVVDPATGNQIRGRIAAAQGSKEYKEITPKRVASEFNGIWQSLPFTEVRKFENSGEGVRASARAQALYATFMGYMDNHDDAWDATVKILKNEYGPSRQGLVAYPIEGQVPKIGDSHDWIDTQFREDAAAAGITVPEGATLLYYAEPEAETRVRRNEPVAYDVIMIDPATNSVVGTGERMPRWVPDYDKEMDKASALATQMYGTPAVTPERLGIAYKRGTQRAALEAGRMPDDLRRELLDLRIEPTAENARKYLDDLRAFGKTGVNEQTVRWLIQNNIRYTAPDMQPE